MRFFSRCRAHSLHLRRIDPLVRRSVRVFSGVNSCPFVQLLLTCATKFKLAPRFKFSPHVTGSRCSGFTQRRFLQRWSRCRPSGISPFASIKLKRWAGIVFGDFFLPDSAKLPYPCEFIAPIHNQQSVSDSFWTFDQKRSCGVFVTFPAMACDTMGRQSEQA